ncbi:hypothetical protein ACVWZZ_007099 [Bradyrhizobium sp. LM6.10]
MTYAIATSSRSRSSVSRRRRLSWRRLPAAPVVTTPDSAVEKLMKLLVAKD